MNPMNRLAWFSLLFAVLIAGPVLISTPGMRLFRPSRWWSIARRA